MVTIAVGGMIGCVQACDVDENGLLDYNEFAKVQILTLTLTPTLTLTLTLILTPTQFVDSASNDTSTQPAEVKCCLTCSCIDTSTHGAGDESV